VAIGIPLCLNILWTPVISALTHGKYGVSDAGQFMILSVCVPFQFLINLLWTISFSGRKYKAVSTITIICAVMNLVLNVILIPRFGGIGAAWAFLITTLIQSAGYYRLVNRDIVSLSLRPLFILMVLCAASYIVAVQMPEMIMIRLSVAVAMYVGLAFLFRQIGRKQLSTALTYFKR
jgi:O-antigen/teichoic acid export membrane protein